MRIALDYDDTYTADPKLWDDFIKLANDRGHEVICLTKRGASNQGFISINGCVAYHTDRKAKYIYCHDNKIGVDIWIDDSPINLFQDG